ncbi:MAG: PAS domain S-box protein [Burkholderiales bacterium]|nr:PAS domain S-box protein [Burkholderiales bacterium]
MTRAFGLRAALILLVLIAIAPVFAVVVQASLSEQQGRLQRAETSLKSVVELSAAHQERLVDGARQMLTAIANSPPVYGDDPAACAGYMKKLQLQFPVAYGTFGLLDAQGRLTCRAEAPASSVVSSDRLFFRTAVQTGRFSVGELVLSRASGRPVLTFGLPVYRDADRGLRGVVYVALDVAQADEHLRRLAIPPEMTLLVLDLNGVVLASAGTRALEVGSRLAGGFLREAVTAGTQRLERAPGAGGGEWLYAVRPVGRSEEGRLFVAGMVSSADVLAPSTLRLRQQLIALAFITVLAAAAAWAFGDRVVVRPISRVLRRMDALEQGEVSFDDRSASRPALREVAELDRRFHGMARSLAERSVQRDGAMGEMEGQRNLLESVLQSMAEGVLVVDPRGHVLHLNAAASAILPGISLLGRGRGPTFVSAAEPGFHHLDGTPLPPEERPVFRALQGEVVEGFRWSARGALTGGAEKIIQSGARPLLGPDARAVGAVLVFSDVTATYQAELALRESEQRYRSLFQSNPHPMWVFDLETLRFLTVNDAAVAHYGYSREEFLAMTIADIRPQEDRGSLLEAARAQQPMHGPAAWRHRLKDGRLIFVEISSHTLEYDGRPARTVLAHDITGRLEAQHALLQLNETLERRVSERTRDLAISNQELESFSYSVSHDLRAPLQVIDGFGRALMARHAQRLDGQALHYLERIRENTGHMSGLIDDLLLLARVTRAEIRRETVDLAPAALRVIERLRARFPEREVAVEIDQPMRGQGDLRLLQVVLENLLENAWKFTARMPAARIHVGCHAGERGETVYFVSDNGAGFDMAYVDKLFHAFQRLHAVTEFEGTGIGLATVHRIISRHGGRVWAEGRPGEGASFRFTLQGVTHDEEQQDPPGRGQPGSPGTHPDDAGREQRPQ